MTTTKWILTVIAASAISSYVTFKLNQSNQNDLDATPGIEFSSRLKFESTNATEQHQEFVKTNKTAGDIQDNYDIKINKIAHHNADIDANHALQESLSQPTNIEDLQFAYEKKQNEISSFRNFIERTGDGALSVISKNYNSESIDPAWARSKEDELLALLDNNETLRNIAPLDLSCKSQNCRLILSAHDGAQGESLYNAFKNEALQGSDENKKQVVSYFTDLDSGEIHIYLSKNTTHPLLNVKMD